MRAVVQRVTRSQVSVAGQVVGKIGPGLMVLLGVVNGDQPTDVDYMIEKISGLRIFADEAGKMNRSVIDIQGQLLVVSQFTLCGDCRKGKRPAFTDAALPDVAKELYESFCAGLRAKQLVVETGVFAADMAVELVNDGPVTILVDSRKLF